MLVPLSNSVMLAEIDEADFYATFTVHHRKRGTSIEVRPCDLNWYMDVRGYVCAKKKSSGIRYHCRMHSLIMGLKSGLVIDHIDQNKLNNKRANLRFTTFSENNFNQKSRPGTSIYKGVTFAKRKNAFQAQIKHQKTNYFLGHFKNELDAALAYDAALRRLCPDAPNAAMNFA